MSYGLSIDLGVTFIGAAVARAVGVEMVSLGERDVLAPAVVFATTSGEILTGEAAECRSREDLTRVAREVKRSLGDPTPRHLGGRPYPAAILLARQLTSAVATVVGQEGGLPAHTVLTYPAVWGPYRMEQFIEVARLAGLADARLITEAEATVAYYAQTQVLPEGSPVLVYDLGGGTCDLTVLRVGPAGGDVLGVPGGLERLGGVDVDSALLEFVDRRLDGALSRLHPGDPVASAIVDRLRRECTVAKETLSVAFETVIPAHLPEGRREVDVSQLDLDQIVRPLIQSTLVDVRRTLQSAGLAPSDLGAVLLAGGSASLPMVAKVLTAEIGAPLYVDVRPKHAVALGAAFLAGTPFAPSEHTGVPGRRSAVVRRRRATDNAGPIVRPHGPRPQAPSRRSSFPARPAVLMVMILLLTLVPLLSFRAAGGSSLYGLLVAERHTRPPATGTTDAKAPTDHLGPSPRHIVGFGDKCIDVPGGKAFDGQHLQMWNCIDQPRQQWTFTSDGTVRAIGMCMSVALGSRANGAAMQLATSSGNPAQRWAVTAVGDLVNSYANKCVDVNNYNPTKGVVLQIWECTGGENQKWRSR